MRTISLSEMKEVEGKGMSWTLWGVIGGVITLIVGIVDGFTNPTKCRN